MQICNPCPNVTVTGKHKFGKKLAEYRYGLGLSLNKATDVIEQHSGRHYSTTSLGMLERGVTCPDLSTMVMFESIGYGDMTLQEMTDLLTTPEFES